MTALLYGAIMRTSDARRRERHAKAAKAVAQIVSDGPIGLA